MATNPSRTQSRIEAENRLLHRAIETITSTTDLERVLRASMELVTEATGGDVCLLHLWDPDQQRLVLRAASPLLEQAVGRVRLRLGEGVAGWVAEHREVVAIPEDKWSDPRYKYIPELRGEEFTAMLSVPLVSRSGALVGVFNVHSRHRREWDSRDIEFVTLTASLVAEAIEHANLFRAVADKEAALEDLVRRTIEAQEEERRRVAAEIHDGVTQQLVSVWYRLQAVRRSLREDPDRAERELEAARQLVDEALAEARVAILDLRPTILDDLGLPASLRALALRQLDGQADLELDVEEGVALPPHHEVALYRVAQEAVTNIRKHAGATRVRMGLSARQQDVVLTIEDDGRGFDPADRPPPHSRTSFGLTGMAERVSLIGGHLRIDSAPGRGTVVEVRVPRLAPREPR